MPRRSTILLHDDRSTATSREVQFVSHGNS
jgi:hypothetical protein